MSRCALGVRCSLAANDGVFSKTPLVTSLALTFHNKPYRLSGVVLHHGESVHAAHYTAIVERGGRWFHANDADVRDSASPDARDDASQRCYMVSAVVLSS